MRRPPTLVLLALVLAALLTACTGTDSGSVSQDGGTSTTKPATTSTTSTTTAPATVTAQVATWKLPAPLSRTACAVDGSSVRCFSGLNAAKTSTANILTIDPGAGSAAVSGRITTAVHDAAGAEFAGKALLVGGGSHEVGTTAVLAVTATASTKVGAMPEPRSDLSVVVAGSRLIVLGGYDGTNITPGVLSSTDGVTFTRIGTLATPVRYGAAVAVGDKVYVFGGKTRQGGADSQTADIQAIDVGAGTVTVVGHFPQAMGHMVAGVLGGGIYVMGGRSGTGVQLTDSAAVWRFDPATGAVTQVASLPAPLTDSTIAVVGDAAYLIGGERSGTPLSQVVTVTAATG